jgi:hypothetical protein
MDVRFRGKNGRAADITGTTEAMAAAEPAEPFRKIQYPIAVKNLRRLMQATHRRPDPHPQGGDSRCLRVITCGSIINKESRWRCWN